MRPARTPLPAGRDNHLDHLTVILPYDRLPGDGNSADRPGQLDTAARAIRTLDEFRRAGTSSYCGRV